MEDITNADYTHEKSVSKDLKIRNLGEYHALYVQNGTLLLPVIFENFCNMFLEIHELVPACFLVSRISMASSLGSFN